MGYIRKALEKGYLEHPGLHAVLMICLRFSSILDDAHLACCLFLSTCSHHVQLTKQRNVDLTTDGLWAMPLNTGWMLVKA